MRNFIAKRPLAFIGFAYNDGEEFSMDDKDERIDRLLEMDAIEEIKKNNSTSQSAKQTAEQKRNVEKR